MEQHSLGICFTTDRRALLNTGCVFGTDRIHIAQHARLFREVPEDSFEEGSSARPH